MVCESCGCELIGDPKESHCYGCGIHVCPNCTLIFQHIGDGEHGIGNPEERYATLRARIAELWRMNDELMRKSDKLEADKARLDWLENQPVESAHPVRDPVDGSWWIYFDDDARDVCAQPSLRAAIDAAMRGNGEDAP